MSMRGIKRALSRGEEGGCKKRRADTDESSWQPRPLSDLKISTIYNRSAPEAPAELFRKDLISAMKLPDSEPLANDEYWVITDSWRQEWERGVQVPVNPDSLPEPAVSVIKQTLVHPRSEFKLPKQKYVRLSKDANFSESEHHLSNTSNKNEAAYDLDACDIAWLRALNGERARAGAHPIREDQLERVIEDLEVRCWDKIQAILKSEEGLGIEYDENVICDVCRSPDSEEGNEMVFCDSCNICVHQACYGITAIPKGEWLCRPCADGVHPTCVLCPNLGGAMKCTPTGNKWAHVSCVLWIPEVSIGCAEKMEPITKISAIPSSRWSLVCTLCRQRTGACIQCSVRTCKTAYHVTCAFKHALEMRAIIEDENADDGVKLRSYCQKHSVNCKKEKSNTGSGSEEDDSKRKRRKDMTSEEKSQARALRLHEIESEFDKHVSIKDISTHVLDVDQDGIQYIYNYWKLKRKSGHNRPLLPPKADENDILTDGQGQADLDKMRMFVQLRQDLERVRNLCYMVSRREKLSRSFFRMREQTFHKQVAVLSEDTLSPSVMTAVIEANHGPFIYDRLYSHPNAVDHTSDFESLLVQIAGVESGDEKKKNLNGLMKTSKLTENPYKRMYMNGSTRRSASLYSGISSGAESITECDPKYRRATYFTTDDEDKSVSQPPKKKLFSKLNNSVKMSDKKQSTILRRLMSSSDEDITKVDKYSFSKVATLRQMELEMENRHLTGSDSDELVTIASVKKPKLSAYTLYSDSENSDNNKDEDANEDKSSNATSDSQQHIFRTKAAVKEFVPPQKGEVKGTRRTKKTPSKIQDSDEDIRDKENIKSTKNKDNPSELIVPQREAAKKASENMRTNTSNPKREQSDSTENKPPQAVAEDTKSKGKPKVKDKKESKEQLKDTNKKDWKLSSSGNYIFEYEKDVEKDANDILAYVPQRRAAKKAAEHIKSGMTKAPGNDAATDDSNNKKKDSSRKSPKKEEDKKPKSPGISSPGSVVSTSSSSSSSEAEEDTVKVISSRSTDKRSMVKSLFSPPRRRNDNLPFLDKGFKVTSSSSPSSESESRREDQSKNSSLGPSTEKKQGTPQSSSNKVVSRKTSDKKPKATDDSAGRGIPEGEKSSGASQQVSRASTRARTRSSTSGARDLFDASGTRKQNQDSSTQENNESGQLSSSQWKTDKKVKSTKKSDSDTTNQSLKKKNKTEDEYVEPVNTSKVRTEDSPKRISNFNSKDKENVRSHKSLSPFPPSPNSPFKDTFKPEIYLPSLRHLSIINEQCKVENIELDKVNVNNAESNTFEKEKTSEKPFHNLFSSKLVVKSPKTIENKVSEPCEGQTPKIHVDINDANTRIPNLLNDEKVSTFETVPSGFEEIHEIVQKSFDKPAPYQNHSIFSPQPIKNHGCDLYDIFTGDSFMNIPSTNDDLIMKGQPLSLFEPYVSVSLKEDSKEDSVRETLYLVEKLRLKMSSKKSTSDNQKESSSDCFAENKEPDPSPLFGECDHPKESNLNKEVEPEKTENVEEKTDTENLPYNATDLEEKPNIADITQIILEEALERNDSNYKKDLSNIKQNEKQVPFDVLTETQDKLKSIPDQEEKDTDTDKNKFLQSDEDKQNNVESNTNSDMALLQIATSQSSDINMSSESHRSNYDNLLIQAPECTPIPSPFNSMRQQPKWAESVLIPARRSSTSSSASDLSIDPMKSDDNEHSNTNDNIPEPENTDMLQNMPFGFHNCAMDPNTYNTFPSEASQFVGVSLFPSTTANSQNSLSTRSTALFPPNVTLPYPNTSSLMPHVPKPNEESIAFNTPCGAAFTSSSHNMAITTAMVAPQTPKGSSEHSPAHEVVPEMTVDNSYTNQSPVSIPEFTANTNANSQSVTEKVTPTSESPSQGKKSPTKPTRTSSRFVSQQGKSPSKSPGKSPRQMDPSTKTNRRGGGKGCRGSRARGRPRGRGSNNYNLELRYFADTIHTKLVGTVYDLDVDEDIANDSINDLKPMRERRKSVDIHGRKFVDVFSDSSLSPSFPSPSQHNQSGKRASYSVDVSDLRPPTPISEMPPSKQASKSPVTITTPVEPSPQFSIVQPVLPGPVDMRTYSAFEPSVATDVFNNHLLGAFASGTADQQLHDIDEEMEKELHSQLMASSNKSEEPVVSQENVTDLSEKFSEDTNQNLEPTIPKVSLSDSRNQLKVKIKGPFLDANYSSSITPASQQPNVPIIDQSSGIPMIGAPSAVSSVTSAMISGTSNLRRMRKKELLRQYCTQDMNMDDPATANVISQVSQPAPVTINRTVITIPKAVASMTSFPTIEDYKAVVDANMEKKRRKMSVSLGRELGLCDDEIKPRDYAGKSAMLRHIEIYHKRKGRISNPLQITPSLNNVAVGPKLKIKIGNYMSSASLANNPGYDPDAQFKPPKKRLTSIPKPSVEDLRRESMKFRKKVFADFEDGRREKKKRFRTEKRKKKRDRRSPEMHVVNKKTESATKLIIRIARKKEEQSNKNDSEEESLKSIEKPVVPVDPYDYDPSAPDPLAIDSPLSTTLNDSKASSSKVSPIRLKLSRGAGGSGYVMKDSPSPDSDEPIACSIPTNKHCQVR